MSAKVGNTKEKNIIGLNGLGKRNEAGEQFIHFWQSNALSSESSIKMISIYSTWILFEDAHQIQIDYIISTKR